MAAKRKSRKSSKGGKPPGHREDAAEEVETPEIHSNEDDVQPEEDDDNVPDDMEMEDRDVEDNGVEEEEEDDEGRNERNDINDEDDDDDDDESVEVADENDDDDMDEDERRPLVNNDIFIPGDEPCTFDLRNLLGISSHPIDSASLYKPNGTRTSPSKAEEPSVTIDRVYAVDEDYLLSKAVAGCNQIIAALWQLPVERTDAGPMVQLPSFDESKIPRALPPPAQKAETKWEKFAKAKGIGQNKDKRSAKVFDEGTGEWQYRHGYKKAGTDKEWPIMEVKAGADPFADPWEAQRDAKRSRVDKNVEARMRNVERAGGLARGTSTRMLKSVTASRQAGRAGGALGVQVLPVGVPVDLKPSGRKGNSDVTEPVSDKSRQRGKTSTMADLLATQVSTASLGKFDKMREGEPDRKKTMALSKKRKIMSNTDKQVVATESDRSLKVLKSLSGGVSKEKDRKKGRLATGETAYDYDYDDGLGASTFRKKKGRAGSGKMKKMTKKRAK